MDPEPIKHPAVLLARVHRNLSPILKTAGFRFHKRNHPDVPIFLWIDYVRGNELISLWWNHTTATLALEYVDGGCVVHTLAKICTAVHYSSRLLPLLGEFVESAKKSPCLAAVNVEG